MRSPLCILCALALCVAPLTTKADNKAAFDPETASIEENIETPEVPRKQSAVVVEAMKQTARRLTEKGYAVTPVRSGEVLMVTVPCSALFAPNETALSAKATDKLAGLLPYIADRTDFKTVVAVHSDNTGDSTYADRITADRANAIDEYFYKALQYRDTGIIPYGIGADEPVVDNHGSANRASNRRVEFYFIPTKDFIAKVRKK